MLRAKRRLAIRTVLCGAGFHSAFHRLESGRGPSRTPAAPPAVRRNRGRARSRAELSGCCGCGRRASTHGGRPAGGRASLGQSGRRRPFGPRGYDRGVGRSCGRDLRAARAAGIRHARLGRRPDRSCAVRDGRPRPGPRGDLALGLAGRNRYGHHPRRRDHSSGPSLARPGGSCARLHCPCGGRARRLRRTGDHDLWAGMHERKCCSARCSTCRQLAGRT